MKAVATMINQGLTFVFTCDPQISEQSPAVDVSLLDEFVIQVLEVMRATLCVVVRYVPLSAIYTAVSFAAWCLT